jgi:hypothetical protein
VDGVTAKASVPIFSNYTDPKTRRQFIPRSMSDYELVAKELLDNAADAAEQSDFTIRVNATQDSLTVTNRGTITVVDVEAILDFHQFYSEKYKKKSFQRGQIGHGLKIALCIAVEQCPVIIESNGMAYTITKGDELSRDPNRVLLMTQEANKCPKDEVTFRVRFTDPTKGYEMKRYVHLHSLVNPHLTYVINDKTYQRTPMKSGKSGKLDIRSYNDDGEDFRRLWDSQPKRATLDEFLRQFAIVPSQRKVIMTSMKDYVDPGLRVRSLLTLLKSKATPLDPPTLGEQALRARAKQCGLVPISYKRVNLKNESSVELLTVSKDICVVGVNESYLPPDGYRIVTKEEDDPAEKDLPKQERSATQTTAPLPLELAELKTKKKWPIRGIIICHHTNTEELSGSNKQTVDVGDVKLWRTIKQLVRIKNDEENWLLKSYGKGPIVDGFTHKIRSFLEDANKLATAMYQAHNRPITLRQLYYKLLSKEIINNVEGAYDALGRHVTKARESLLISDDLFEDRSRYVLIPQTEDPTITSGSAYIKNRLREIMLEPPDLDRWTKQHFYVEVWIEKDALSGVLRDTCARWQVPLFPCRGYASRTKIVEAHDRLRQAKQRGKHLVIVYAGDLDPSGWNIYESVIERVTQPEDLRNVAVVRAALNPDQITGLFPMPPKKSDPRFAGFPNNVNEWAQKKGIEATLEEDQCFELDALDSDQLINIVDESISGYFNESLVNHQQIQKFLEDFRMAGDILSKSANLI